jgi:5-methylcytosine-specific restriction endonuclease McrA
MPRTSPCFGVCGRIIQMGRGSSLEPVCRPCRRELGGIRYKGAAPQPSVPCPECSTPFVPTSKGRRGLTVTCSKSCAQRYARVKVCSCGAPAVRRRRCADCHAAYDLDRTAARRARLVGARTEPYHRLDIFTRDDWRCQLCDGDVNPAIIYPHPLSASIDHAVPISLGGADAPDNVQLAHLRCNISKGARVACPASPSPSATRR